VLTGISVYVNVAAIVCALVALPLFIGSKRQRFLDKNNLLGFVLLGIAMLLHGGFQTLLRSSPHAVFSGYLLGWDGGSEDRESSLWIYDLGFPPADTVSFYEFPNRNLNLRRSRNNRVPASFWNTDRHEYVKCDYRVWDQEITRIDAVPVPDAKQAASGAWRWQSQSEGRAGPFLEALLGFLITCKCILLLGKKEPTGEVSSIPAVRRFPNKWAARIYIAAVSIILAWIVFVRLSDRFFQHRAQVLLRQIQQLELRKSNWQDAERIREDYGKHVKTDAGCSGARCDFTIKLEHLYQLQLSRFGGLVGIAWRLSGGRWAVIYATVRVRDGVVWGKDFTAIVSHREGYPLIADARATRTLGLRPWYPRDPHPNIRFGRPGGCELCQELWAKVTPYASSAEMQDAFAFDLSCIGTTLRLCTDMSQMMPVAARRMGEDSRASDSGTTLARLAWTPAMVRACGRDAANAAVAEALLPDLKKSTQAGKQIERVDYRILQVLKGTLAAPVLHATFYPSRTAELPSSHQHVIVFGSGDDAEIFVPFTDSNLQEVQAGIAEAAVDIPGSQ
jgi:hypothetical protein